MKENILRSLELTLPPIIVRREISRLTGGLISAKFLANLDCAGLGPKGRVKIGRLTAYSRESFVSWLSDRMQDIEIIDNHKK